MTTGTDKQIHQLDMLQDLLEEQIKLARQNKIADVEKLSAQAGALAEEITKGRIPEQAEFKDRCEHLAELYRKLVLILTAHKEQAGDQLRRISEGRKTLQTYRSNV